MRGASIRPCGTCCRTVRPAQTLLLTSKLRIRGRRPLHQVIPPRLFEGHHARLLRAHRLVGEDRERTHPPRRLAQRVTEPVTHRLQLPHRRPNRLLTQPPANERPIPQVRALRRRQRARQDPQRRIRNPLIKNDLITQRGRPTPHDEVLAHHCSPPRGPAHALLRRTRAGLRWYRGSASRPQPHTRPRHATQVRWGAQADTRPPLTTPTCGEDPRTPSQHVRRREE